MLRLSLSSTVGWFRHAMFVLTLFLFIVGTIVPGSAQSSAAIILKSLYSVGNNHAPKEGSVTGGYQFAASSQFTVTDLGVYDSSQDGLLDSHAVGIWDSTGALVASTTVGSGTAGTLDGYFRYASINPTALSAGTYTIGAFYLADANNVRDALLLDQGSGAGTFEQTIASGITLQAGAYSFGSALTNPTNFFPNSDAIFGPNFKMLTSSIPEPAFYQMGVLLAMGGTGVWRMRRRKR